MELSEIRGFSFPLHEAFGGLALECEGPRDRDRRLEGLIRRQRALARASDPSRS